METLAYVEILDRHGEVLRRHALDRLPARIGRAYCADVMIDDPYMAADHLEIRLAADGRLEALDLGSVNGTSRVGDKSRLTRMPVHGDDVVRAGHTLLRFRQPGHPVPAETPLRQRAHGRRLFVLAGSVALFAGLVAWGAYVMTYDTDQSQLFSMPVGSCITILAWAAIWSLVSRTVRGRAEFVSHGIVAFLGCSISLLVDALIEYIWFSFDLQGFNRVWTICLSLVLAGMLYGHLRLTVRLSPRTVLAMATAVTMLFVGGVEASQAIRNASKPGVKSFGRLIKPDAFLFAEGIPPDQFVGTAARLKEKTDANARES